MRRADRSDVGSEQSLRKRSVNSSTWMEGVEIQREKMPRSSYTHIAIPSGKAAYAITVLSLRRGSVFATTVGDGRGGAFCGSGGTTIFKLSFGRNDARSTALNSAPRYHSQSS